MGLKDRAKRMASSAAGVALATTGLSNCSDNGAVDPSPPPFQCSEVNMGQSLLTNATISGDTIDVTIRNQRPENTWVVNAIRDVTGVSLVSVALPDPAGQQVLRLRLRLNSPAVTQGSFVVESQFFGFGLQCPYQRTYTLTISSGTVQISDASADVLPLAARQKAEIVLAGDDGGIVQLEGRTPYPDAHELSWTVSAGQLDQRQGTRVTWQLPRQPGMYAAELVIDFGADGFGYDVLMLEVLPDQV